MPVRDLNEDLLAKVDSLLVQAELRFSVQLLRVESLKLRGRNADDAEAHLRAIEQSVQAHWAHRSLILKTSNRAG